MISQQTPITGDGNPSEDSSLECVTTCILAAMMYLLGIPVMNAQWNPDAIKDVVYGQGYVGTTAASAYVDFCKARGVNIWSFKGMPAILVDEIHKQIQAGLPVLVTVPDIYVPASYGWTHVLCMFSERPGELTALDPWPGKPITKSDQEWTQILLDNEIWTLEKEDTDMRVDLNTPGIGNFFTPSGNGWLCKQTGKLIHGAILEEYQQRGWNAMWGLPKSNETPIETFPEFVHLAGKGIVVQWFQRMAAAYDPEHLLPGEPPPNSGAVYPLQLFGEGPGIDPRLRSTRAELAAAQAEVAQLKAQPVPVPVVDSRVAKFEQMKAIATS